MSGKRAKAACGHDGEHVIGNFIRCLKSGCDGLAFETEEPTQEIVPSCCGSPMANFPLVGGWHCWSCGKVAKRT